MKLTLGVMATVAAIAVAGGAAAQDQNRLQTILDRGHIIVGTGSTNPPWHFKDDAGTLIGYDVDMGHLLAKAIFDDPTKVEYVIQSSDSRIPNVLTDKVDITCQFMTVTAGRAQQVDFTIPYYREGVGLLLMKNGKYKNFDEVKAAGSAATISILANVYAEELVHQALPEAKVDQYDSDDLIYQALKSGRADAAATDMSSALWFVAQNPDQYIEGGYGWSPRPIPARSRRATSSSSTSSTSPSARR
jgi:polar amino acid transport system substrate-binding protein